MIQHLNPHIVRILSQAESRLSRINQRIIDQIGQRSLQ